MQQIRFISSFLIVVLFSLVSLAAPEILRIETDKFGYTIGDRAFVSAWYIPDSKNPEVDVFFKIKVNGQPVEVVNVAGGRGLALSPSLNLAVNSLVVEVFLRNKRKVFEYEKAILSLNQEVVEIQRLLESETDIEIRGQLNAIVDRNNALVVSIKNRIDNARKKIAQKTSTLYAVSLKTKSEWSDALVVKFDRESRIYNAGDVMNVDVRVLNEVRDKNGLHEIWIDGYVEGTGTNDEIWMDYKMTSDLSYRLFSPEFTSLDLGRRRHISRLWSRPFKQSSAIGKAIFEIKKNMLELQLQKRKSSDPIEIGYFDDRMAYLGVFVSNLDNFLDNAWTLLSDERADQFDIQ